MLYTDGDGTPTTRYSIFPHREEDLLFFEMLGIASCLRSLGVDGDREVKRCRLPGHMVALGSGGGGKVPPQSYVYPLGAAQRTHSSQASVYSPGERNVAFKS